MTDSETLVPGRSCDECTLCCKVMRVDALKKPKGVWCTHCDVGTGCKIYEERPPECSAFYCGYRTNHHFGEHWNPTVSKMVIVWRLQKNDGSRMIIHVDPGHPTVWRKEPYYSDIKRMAVAGVDANRVTLVTMGKRYIAMFPNKEIDLGIVADDESVLTGAERRPNGTIIDFWARKVKTETPEGGSAP